MNKPSSGAFRVCRGGSWFFGPDNARVAVRFIYFLGFRFNFLGFRLIRGISALELIMEDSRER